MAFSVSEEGIGIKRIIFWRILSLLTLIGITQSHVSQAAIVVDQQCTSRQPSIISFYNVPMQSFQTQANNLVGASVGLNPGTSDIQYIDITISLFDGNPLSSGNLLRSGTDYDVWLWEPNTDVYADVSWEPIVVSPGSELFLRFDSTEPNVMIPGHQSWEGSDAYESGMMHTEFGPQSEFDLNFITYTDTAFVPIPPSAWLLGTGLIGLMAIRRKVK